MFVNDDGSDELQLMRAGEKVASFSEEDASNYCDYKNKRWVEQAWIAAAKLGT